MELEVRFGDELLNYGRGSLLDLAGFFHPTSNGVALSELLWFLFSSGIRAEWAKGSGAFFSLASRADFTAVFLPFSFLFFHWSAFVATPSKNALESLNWSRLK